MSASDEWQLRDPTANQIHRLAKADAQQLKDIGSPMPEGPTAGLTRKELLNLIRFLVDQGASNCTIVTS